MILIKKTINFCKIFIMNNSDAECIFCVEFLIKIGQQPPFHYSLFIVANVIIHTLINDQV